MNKGEYINELINNIKNDIEFDGDIIALEKLLEAMLKIDVSESIKSFQDLLINYDIFNKRKDIDFIPLLYDYPLKLLNKIKVEDFFEIINQIPLKVQKMIYSYIFNVYDNNFGIWEVIKSLIIREQFIEEKELIYNILENSKVIPVVTFDLTEFLKKIILLHLSLENNNLEFLLELANIPTKNKEKALLHALLIDYI